MSRSAIPTYTTNQIITAAHGNTYWRDNEAAHWSLIGDVPQDYELIQQKTLGGNGAIEFTGISQDYSHLEMFVSGRMVASVVSEFVCLILNGDTNPNYDHQRIYASGSSPAGSDQIAQNHGFIGWYPGQNAIPSTLNGYSVLHFINYSGTNGNKVVLVETSSKTGITTGLMTVVFVANYWRSSAAITKIKLFGNTRVYFNAGAQATLYGIK